MKCYNYMLLVLIFDSFIQLFVPFTSLCPNLNPPATTATMIICFNRVPSVASDIFLSPTSEGHFFPSR